MHTKLVRGQAYISSEHLKAEPYRELVRKIIRSKIPKTKGNHAWYFVLWVKEGWALSSFSTFFLERKVQGTCLPVASSWGTNTGWSDHRGLWPLSVRPWLSFDASQTLLSPPAFLCFMSNFLLEKLLSFSSLLLPSSHWRTKWSYRSDISRALLPPYQSKKGVGNCPFE